MQYSKILIKSAINSYKGYNMVITRFAPSPTGYLHIGGLRTALFNYLHARKNGGKFLIRIEDTDLARNSRDATKAILESFAWVGLECDGEIIYQSQRFDLYTRYAKQLVDEGKAYYCYMSKEELEALRDEQRARGETPRYDNRYRDFSGTPPEGITPVIRIKAPLEGEIAFDDGVKGRICVQAKELDDFIILRSDGSPTYNFVVAIDDALMGVTDVIRGDDHTSNTPKQIIIYNALNFTIPKFYHIPMILNPEGKKLSKRDGAMGVMDYKLMGYLPEALLNFLVRLGWSYEDKEIFSLQEMQTLFSADAMNSSPSRYNQEKFLWLNQHYIKECNNARLEVLLDAFGTTKFVGQTLCKDLLYSALKDRSKTLLEFATQQKEILLPPESYDEKMLKKLDPLALEVLAALVQTDTFANKLSLTNIQTTADMTQALCALEEWLCAFAESNHIKIGKLMIALRLALLGKGGGIGVCDALMILGINEATKRIQTFLALHAS